MSTSLIEPLPPQKYLLNGFLSSTVIEDLERLCEVREDIGLFYFYIDGSEQRPLAAEILYRSVIAQLVSRLAEIPDFLTRLYKKFGPAGYSHHKPIPIKAWASGVQITLEKFDRIFVVLDGLDECEDSIGFEGIVGFMNEVMIQAAGRVHTIAFSRDLEQLRQHFDELNATRIAIDGESLRFDLERALTQLLMKTREFKRWPQSLTSTVRTSLLSQAHGS